MKNKLLVFFGIVLIIFVSACSSNDNSTEKSKIDSSSVSEKKVENSLVDYPTDEWHFGKIDIPGFMAESDSDEAQTLVDLALVSKLSLSKYFSDNTGNIDVEFKKDGEDFYSFSLTNSALKNANELKLFEKNVQTLMDQKPVNETINLYTFTGIVRSTDGKDDPDPVFLSYTLNPDGTISKV